MLLVPPKTCTFLFQTPSLSLWPLFSIHSSEHDVVAPPEQSDALPLLGSAVCFSYIPVISTACSYQLGKSVITLLSYIREVGEGGACSHCLFRAFSVGISSAPICIPIDHDPNIPTCSASTVVWRPEWQQCDKKAKQVGRIRENRCHGMKTC